MEQEIKVTHQRVTYLVEVSKSGTVDVYYTILGGIASGSLAGQAVLKNGKLTKKNSETLTKEAWSIIEVAVKPAAVESNQNQLLLPE